MVTWAPDGILVTVGGKDAMTDSVAPEMIITPGGARLRSVVHELPPDAVLDGTDGRHRLLAPGGAALADFGDIPLRDPAVPLMPGNVARPASIAPALGSGWITYAFWNRPADPISSFSTRWVVPPAPRTHSGQLIYLFNGIQNSTMIFQPVLQWGSNGGFGGEYWCVATWYADGQTGQAFHSSPVRVNVGDNLTGVLTLTGNDAQGLSYNSEFTGIAGSGYTVQHVNEMWQAVETLECYNMTTCTDYPRAVDTAMTAISVRTGSATPTLSWTPVDQVTDCNQHTVVVSNDASNGEVDIFYPTPFIDWRQLDGNRATVAIVADGGALYQLHNTGKIWRYTGVPMTGWQQLDGNPATVAVAASGGHLYQLHNTGKIWRYTGPPMTGWEQLDGNPASATIVAGGGQLYQLHSTGKIWQYTG